MALEPINYTALQTQVNPIANFAQGLQTGNQIKQFNDMQAMQEQYKQDMGALLDDPTPQAIQNMMLKHPEQAKVFEPILKDMSEAQRKSDLLTTGQIYAALNSGNNDVATQIIQRKIDASKNSGIDTTDLDQIKQMIEVNPKAAMTFAGLYGTSLDPKFAENIGKVGTELRAQEKAPVELEKLKSDAEKARIEALFLPEEKTTGIEKTKAEITKAKVEAKKLTNDIYVASERLKLDKQTTAADVALKYKQLGDIPTDARKLVNEKAIEASGHKQSSIQYTNLANDLEKMGGGYGAASSAAEWLKKATGNQDAMTDLRNRYQRAANSQVINSLPKGPASDKDIAFAKEGVPPSSADPQTMVRFMRGLAKMENLNAEVKNAQADWAANNNGQLTRAQTNFLAGNFQVKKGENLTDFEARIAGELLKTTSTPTVPKATPTAPTQSATNAMTQADKILQGLR